MLTNSSVIRIKASCKELWSGKELEIDGFASFNWIFAELSTMNERLFDKLFS